MQRRVAGMYMHTPKKCISVKARRKFKDGIRRIRLQSTLSIAREGKPVVVGVF